MKGSEGGRGVQIWEGSLVEEERRGKKVRDIG